MKYFLMIFPLFIFGCGLDSRNSSEPSEPTVASDFIPDPSVRTVGKIRFDQRVSDHDYAILAKDLYALRTLPFETGHPNEMKHILGDLKDLSNESLVNWLENRVRYLVHKEYLRNPDQARDSAIMASNLGCVAYQLGKEEGKSYFFDIPGVGHVNAPSPRVGVIRLGELVNAIDIKKFGTSSSIFRLATLFHEAKHSDGHGPHTCFPHVPCPQGHAYAGKLACDQMINGPYRVAALMMKAALRGCQQCSAAGREKLNLFILDNLDRIVGNSVWDPTPVAY